MGFFLCVCTFSLFCLYLIFLGTVCKVALKKLYMSPELMSFLSFSMGAEFYCRFRYPNASLGILIVSEFLYKNS